MPSELFKNLCPTDLSKEFDYLESFISKQQIIEMFTGVEIMVYWRVKSHLGITKTWRARVDVETA